MLDVRLHIVVYISGGRKMKMMSAAYFYKKIRGVTKSGSDSAINRVKAV